MASAAQVHLQSHIQNMDNLYQKNLSSLSKILAGTVSDSFKLMSKTTFPQRITEQLNQIDESHPRLTHSIDIDRIETFANDHHPSLMAAARAKAKPQGDKVGIDITRDKTLSNAFGFSHNLIAHADMHHDIAPGIITLVQVSNENLKSCCEGKLSYTNMLTANALSAHKIIQALKPSVLESDNTTVAPRNFMGMILEDALQESLAKETPETDTPQSPNIKEFIKGIKKLAAISNEEIKLHLQAEQQGIPVTDLPKAEDVLVRKIAAKNQHQESTLL